jgi:class 3 adenylate cyclase
VDALVILEGTARYLSGEDYPEGLPRRRAIAPLELWGERWGSEVNPWVVEVVAPSMADDPRWRRVLGRMQRKAGTPRATHRFWEMFGTEDVRHALARVRAPALVMHAVGDRLIPIDQTRFLAKGIPGARFVQLPGADHFPWFTNTDRVAAETQELLTGSRGGTGGARRLCTVLFIDIVGSTERLSELGDTRWRDVLSDYERIVRSHLLRYGGQEVSFMGDGVLALFGDPIAAIDCARALTATVRELGLEIRAGMHTGMVEIRGDDVAGMGVHIAARVMAVAGASEVLVTRTISDLLIGVDVNLEPRGAHELKGVPDQLELFALSQP